MINKELIIDSGSSEVVIALLEDKRLVELNREKNNSSFAVGDVYLGRVRKIVPGLNAAFVDVGYEKDAFLHYLDLGPQINSLVKYSRNLIQGKNPPPISNPGFVPDKDIEKSGRIGNILSPNMEILVQVAKEPISSKGPRITSEIAFAGRYMVLVPFSDRVSVSQKIKNNEERNRLKRLVMSIKPKNFGVIIRTVAENKKVAELIGDLEELVGRWTTMVSRLPQAKAPRKVLSEIDRSSAMLRDLLNASFNSVIVNDQGFYEELKSYIKTIAPDKVDILRMHKGKVNIFEHYGIDKQIRGSFGKKVTFKNGAYLIIDHTEAMHVVDVNSGQRMNNPTGQEANALDVNLEAAIEIARQLRLRDMGGIIVIDFIDMHEAVNRRKLYEKIKTAMASDRAKHTILPPSKFGLVQITRQRVRPEMNIKMLEKCPVCEGSGEIKASITLIDEIENHIRFLIQEQNEASLQLCVHPIVYSYLKKGLMSFRTRWFMTFRKWIKLTENPSYHFLEYHFFNKKGDEIKV